MLTLSIHKAFRQQLLDGRKTQTRRVARHGSLLGPLDAYELCFESPPIRTPFDGDQEWLLRSEFDNTTDVHVLKPKLSIGETFRFDGVDADFTCTGIRCERLQEISEEDALVSGLIRHEHVLGPRGLRDCFGISPFSEDGNDQLPIKAYADLWSHIYPTGPKSWESNPPVFVYEFEYIGKEGE